jgi:hypothetical protein
MLMIGAATPSVHVQWKDGAPVATVGILGDMSPETLAREKAARGRIEELRQQNVILDDWRAQNE